MNQTKFTTKERIVTPQMTAAHMGSGSLQVFATPALVALMEEAAVSAAQDILSEGQTSVGTRMVVDHLAATPVGMRVQATATLIEQEDRQLLFSVEASDECQVIGRALHTRVLVNADRFQAKADGKSNP